jgi:hypothetical protein
MRAPSQHRPSSSKPHGETNGDSGNGTEKFPDFDAGITNGQSASPLGPNGYALNGASHGSGDRWQARRDSRVRWAPNAPAAHAQGHNRSTSMSQAFRHIRSASVSQNAHEIAGALRAPVSWKLIVCLPSPFGLSLATLLIPPPLGTLCNMVLVLGPDEYLIQVDTYGLRQTCDTYYNTVRLRSGLLLAVLVASVHIPSTTNLHTSLEAPDTLPLQGCHPDYPATCWVPNSRTSAQLECYLKDTRVSGAHHQRTVTVIYRPRIPIHL